MRISSSAFERVFVPKLSFSRWAVASWLVQHALGMTGLLISALETYVKVGGTVLIVSSALIALPQTCRVVARLHNGAWLLPGLNAAELRMLPGTRYTRWWIVLRLGSAQCKAHTLQLWCDAFTADDWRALQISLREHRRQADG